MTLLDRVEAHVAARGTEKPEADDLPDGAPHAIEAHGTALNVQEGGPPDRIGEQAATSGVQGLGGR